MAASLGAGRVEIAHAQYYGWALRNRQALMPTREQVARAMQEMESIRPRYRGPAGDRSGRAGLLCAAAEGVHGRLGAPLAERHAVRPRAAVPCGRDHSRPAVLVGARPLAGGDLAASRRRFRHFAAPTGCRSRAAPASCARSISAAAAVRRWRSRATRRRRIRPASCRRIMHGCWRLPNRMRRQRSEAYVYRGRAVRDRPTPIPAR